MYDQRENPTRSFDAFVPRIGPLESVRRHKLLALLPVIAAIGLAILYSEQRQPIYTAEARQTIGRIDVSAPGALSGFAGATRALASTYSRAIVAPDVIAPTAQATGLPATRVRSNLSASPIPESSVIAVRGTGTSEREATTLANVGARSLERFVAGLNARNPNADRLLRAFKRSSRREALASEGLARERRAAGPNRSRAASNRIARARERAESAQLDAFATRQNYSVARRSESNVSILQTISLAQSAKSDRSSRVQIVLFMALVAGVLLGIALASLRANLRARRAVTLS